MVGRKLSHFEVLEQIGQGGMGVVYKARDLNLGRLVALKVLSAKTHTSGESYERRLSRFTQEAKAASALNHPNIVTIYEISRDGEIDFIAMEYIQGCPIGDLIARKPMPAGDALRHALQIASALTKAHEAGIVHRDLKPANIMVTGDGLVKVLDFGLAKLTESVPGDEFSNTETMTEGGSVAGTVGYMSPEQAEGKPIDGRSDIFSFGCLLYEMVTGQRAFRRESKSATIAALLRDDPVPAGRLVPGTPHELDRIISRCMRKARERRWQTMADVKAALEDLRLESESGIRADAAKAGTGFPKLGRTAAWIAAGALLVSSAVLLDRWRRGPPPPILTASPLTSYNGNETSPSFSPDGNQIAFLWNGEKQNNADIYVKLVGPGSPLRLTSNPARDISPAWSPDGRTIAFLRFDKPAAVYTVPALGGPERMIAEVALVGDDPAPNLAWSSDSRYLIASDRGALDQPVALFALSPESGNKRRLTQPPSGSWGDVAPALSPSGEMLAFVRVLGPGVGDLYVLPVHANLNPAGELKRLTVDNRLSSSLAWTANSREIIFSSGPAGNPSLWRVAVSGKGAPRRLVGAGEDGASPAISPAGNRLIYNRSFSDSNIWRVDLDSTARPSGDAKLFISSTRHDFNPDFSPDGNRVVFSSNRSGSFEIWVCDQDGSNAGQLTSFNGPLVGSPRWSPDGAQIAFDASAGGHWDIYLISAKGGSPRRITQGPAENVRPAWSRDGRWVYFASRKAGPHQVWRIPSAGGAPVQITRNGGFAAQESPDGRELYYTRSDTATALWKMPVAGGPESLVTKSIARRAYTVVKEGVYYIPGAGVSASTHLMFLRFASRRDIPIAPIDKPVSWSMSVSPDNGTILYALIDQQGSDLMLVENFR